MFRDSIDPEKLKRISAYTVDSENFGMVATLANQDCSWLFCSPDFTLARQDHQPVAIRTDCGWSDFLCCTLGIRQSASHPFQPL